MSTSILGLDVGMRRTGVAVSDPERRLAMPLETVPCDDRKAAIARILELVEQRECEVVVVGWPLSMDGKEGRATRRVASFTDALDEMARARGRVLTIVRWDERLTTTAAEAGLIERGVRRERRKGVVDQIAATMILEGYLSSLAAGASDA